jgi:hypothetical protein
VRFEQIESRSKPPRVLRPECFVVADERVYLFNERNNPEAAERLQ